MNGITAEDSLATSVSTPTAVNSSSAAQNEFPISDDEVGVPFLRIPVSGSCFFFVNIQH